MTSWMHPSSLPALHHPPPLHPCTVLPAPTLNPRTCMQGLMAELVATQQPPLQRGACWCMMLVGGSIKQQQHCQCNVHPMHFGRECTGEPSGGANAPGCPGDWTDALAAEDATLPADPSPPPSPLLASAKNTPPFNISCSPEAGKNIILKSTDQFLFDSSEWVQSSEYIWVKGKVGLLLHLSQYYLFIYLLLISSDMFLYSSIWLILTPFHP